MFEVYGEDGTWDVTDTQNYNSDGGGALECQEEV